MFMTGGANMFNDRGGVIHDTYGPLRAKPLCLLEENRLEAHLHLAEGYVSRAFCIKPMDFFTLNRGPKHVSDARQLMMYLAHVEFGLSLALVGRRYFRDRSTASHACKKIEIMREDPFFDELVSEIEALITLRRDPLFGASFWGAQ
jgi:hypothetical protein